MKKIAILSPYNEPNYGTVLQAYALAVTIKSFGYECEYIAYSKNRPLKFGRKIIHYILSPKLLFSFLKTEFFSRRKKKSIDSFIFWDTEEFVQTKQRFQQFLEDYIPYSSRCYYHDTINSLLNNYSCFIVGSDQTWSEARTSLDNSFFLDFVKNSNLKNAYAPSIGTTIISPKYQKVLVDKLSSFNYISCREKKNCDLLSRLIGKKVSFVLDPTLLLNVDTWRKIESKTKIKEKYILCYILGEREVISDFANHLSKTTGISVKYIVTRPKYIGRDNAINGVGPQDFLLLIDNASYIVTDSFHGTILSINYNKEFYSFCKREEDVNSGDNDRIVEFLEILGLVHRFKMSNDGLLDKMIDYKDVNIKLSQLRLQSLEFLTRMLHNA
jgi:hypothetical protein